MRFALRPLARLTRPSLPLSRYVMWARFKASQQARLDQELMSSTMATATSYIPADVRPLTDADKANVAATAPVLAEHGVTITKEMYKVS